jgi:hypothetical protein
VHAGTGRALCLRVFGGESRAHRAAGRHQVASQASGHVFRQRRIRRPSPVAVDHDIVAVGRFLAFLPLGAHMHHSLGQEVMARAEVAHVGLGRGLLVAFPENGSSRDYRDLSCIPAGSRAAAAGDLQCTAVPSITVTTPPSKH